MSVLNVLSKILERAVYSQLSSYLEKRGILFNNQSGFRSGFSTDSSLLELSDFVKGEMKVKETMLGWFSLICVKHLIQSIIRYY